MRPIFKKIGFFTAFIIPGLVFIGYSLGGIYNFLPILFSFLILPVIDQLLGTDTSNVPESDAVRVGSEFYYRFVTYTWTWFQLAFLIWGAFAVAEGKLSELNWFGFVLSFSLVTGGIGITVAHELGHRKSEIEKFYSKALLMTVCYMHFYVEHNRGHHVHVGTLRDPATARKNENFYSFWMRSVFKGYIHSWHLVNDGLRRKGKSTFSFSNEMLWFAILPLAFCACLTALVSHFHGKIAWEVPIFFFAQSFFAFTLLELVNYVEHYGILRKEISPGRFERVNPLHSWNASHLLSNFFLFQLQRHSDHHVFAHKRYQVLNHYDESPQLPFGYPTMILLALVPPVWFSMMNRRLEEWEKVVYA